ncbi:MAG: T9SS type A sorting domain-containing protein [Calditrichota bacterium]
MKMRAMICMTVALVLLGLSLPKTAHAWCNPRDIICGTVIDSNNAQGHTDVDKYNCTGNTRFRGKAHVYRIHFGGGRLTINLAWEGSSELGVFLLGSCNRNDCLAYDPHQITIDLDWGDYWIIVDGRSTTSNSYELGVYCGDEPLPVELTSFDAVSAGDGVHLQWTVASETHNDRFEIRRRNAAESEWSMVGSVRSRGDASSAVTYDYADLGIVEAEYSYQLVSIDLSGVREILGEANVNHITAVETLEPDYRLVSNYPNPFNPGTTIRFEVAENSPVLLEVYDVNGRLIRELAQGIYTAGVHEVRFEAGDLPSGLYFARMTAGPHTDIMKMILMK